MSDPLDLARRLRADAVRICVNEQGGYACENDTHALLRDAADLIESQHAEIERLREKGVEK